MIIKSTPQGIVVEEARRFELIDADLFEAPGSRHSCHVEATADGIRGYFVIHALNGEFVYRITGWCSWLPAVVNAELESPGVIYREPARTTAR